MVEHTKGPWKLDSGRTIKTSSGEFYLAYGKDRYANPLWHESFAELDSNARLIASAPDLLAALEPLATWAEHERREHRAAGEENEAEYMGTLADNARAAIRKAKGN